MNDLYNHIQCSLWEQYGDHFTFFLLLFEILNVSAHRIHALYLCFDGDAWLDHCRVGLGTW